MLEQMEHIVEHIIVWVMMAAGETQGTIFANRPGKFENVNHFKSHEVKFRDRLRNCEDVLVEEDMGIAFLSCNPERDQWNTVMVRSRPLDLPLRAK